MNISFEAEGVLRRSGLKVTPKRVDILETIARLAHPVTTQEIYDNLNKAEADVATVYRNIISFVQAGIVKQLTLRPNIAHYELDIEQSDHHHIICTACGEIEELPNCAVHSVAHTVLKNSKKFESITGHTFELFGMCKKCQ